MPYAINAGSIVQINFEGLLFDQQVITTHHYLYGGVTIADGATWLTNFLAADVNFGLFFDAYRACLSSNVLNLRIKGQWIYPLRYRKITVAPAADTGTGGTTGTANSACVVSLFSDLAARQGISNKHLPGLPEIMQVNGAVLPGQRALMSSYGDQARNVFTVGANTLTPVIYHRAAPAASKIITETSNNPYVRTMRRRTVGLGS